VPESGLLTFVVNTWRMTSITEHLTALIIGAAGLWTQLKMKIDVYLLLNM